jgi:hypothetical protein
MRWISGETGLPVGSLSDTPPTVQKRRSSTGEVGKRFAIRIDLLLRLPGSGSLAGTGWESENATRQPLGRIPIAVPL